MEFAEVVLSASLGTEEKYLWISLSVVLFLFSILVFVGNHCFRRLHNFSLSPENKTKKLFNYLYLLSDDITAPRFRASLIKGRRLPHRDGGGGGGKEPRSMRLTKALLPITKTLHLVIVNLRPFSLAGPAITPTSWAILLIPETIWESGQQRYICVSSANIICWVYLRAPMILMKRENSKGTKTEP